MNKISVWCLVGGLALSTFGIQARATSNNDDLSFLSSVVDWSDWGQNINNTHFNLIGGIQKSDLNSIVKLCAIDYRANPTDPDGTVGAKPLIVNDVVYWSAQPGPVGGQNGQIGAHKLVRDSSGNFIGCKKLWQKTVSDIVNLGVPGLTTRTSPAYYVRSNGKGTLLYLTPSNLIDYAFNHNNPPTAVFTIRPTAYALDAATGQKLWQVAVSYSGSEDPSSMMMNTTSSPRVYQGYAYFGLSSFNNLKTMIGFPGDMEQTARGHLIRLDLKINGGTPSFPQDVKTIYSIPAKPAGYQGKWFAGGGIWASTPSIIPYGGKNNQGLIIYSSGQLYDYPQFVADCMSEQVTPVVIQGQSFSKRGETGGGAKQCYDRAVQQLTQLGVDVNKEPLANNSVIAVNMADFTHAWHVATNGIDAWQAPCSPTLDSGSPACTLPVVGPDWDIGGNSPIVVRYLLQTTIISHNKGGELFWISPYTGQVQKHADVCVASSVGGIHWGFAYDPIRKTLLVPCSGSDVVNSYNYTATAANGISYCKTGMLDGIDVVSGALKWQSIPSRAVLSSSPECANGNTILDERFKYGKTFDIVIKNQALPNVHVSIMPDSPMIPVNASTGRGDGVPSTSQGVVYWPMANGAVYAIDVNNGSYLNQFFCDKGGIYTASPSVADGYIAFGCGRQSVVANDGGIFTGHSIMVYGKQKQ